VPFATSFSDIQARLLTTVDFLVDVGANTGQYAERCRALGYKGPILSFEPASSAFSVLASRAKRDDAWHVRRVALGSSFGTVSLNLSENSKSSSTLGMLDAHVSAAPNSRYVTSEEVDMAPLDACLAEFSGGRIWLKIDVQGTEHQVIAGASATLPSVDVVHCELSVAPLYEGQADYLQLLTELRSSDLHVVAMEPEFQDPKTGNVLQFDAILSRLGS
jgi:FkbM family methyltransferase